MTQGEGVQHGSTLCSTVRAMCYLQQGCSRFVVYVMDTSEKGKMTMDDVSIVQEYLDVFLEELSGVPPERHVEFRIDLVPGAARIAKAPYRLAPQGCMNFLPNYKSY